MSSPVGTEERDRNRRQLRDLKESWEREIPVIQQAIAQAKADHAQVQEDHAQVQAQLAQMRQQSQQEIGRLVQEAKQEISQQINRTKQEMQQEISQQISTTKKESEQRIQQNVKQLDSKIEKIVDAPKRPPDSDPHLSSRVAALSAELQGLVAKLEDSGIFKPPIPEMPEGAPAVGTMQLEEDIYTTRLLMKLGFMRGVSQQISNGKDEKYDSSSEDDSLLEERFHGVQPLSPESLSNITGLNVPETEIGSSGYYTTTRGFISVCATTASIQVLVLAIFIRYGLAQKNCTEDDIPVLDQFLLQLSKLLAMLVLGGMMGTEFMGILNYYMVCDLLLETKDWEFVLTAVFQVLLNITLMVTNVLIFLHTTSPGDVWLNMTALTFIATLDSDVLGMAKQGFFGHSVGKSVTEVNYELTFNEQYPTWFPAARRMTCIVVIGFVAICGAWVFLYELPTC